MRCIDYFLKSLRIGKYCAFTHSPSPQYLNLVFYPVIDAIFNRVAPVTDWPDIRPPDIRPPDIRYPAGYPAEYLKGVTKKTTG